MKKNISINLPRNEVVIYEEGSETTIPLGDAVLIDLTDAEVKQLIKAQLQITGDVAMVIER